jgi:hypothetical protein
MTRRIAERIWAVFGGGLSMFAIALLLCFAKGCD